MSTTYRPIDDHDGSPAHQEAVRRFIGRPPKSDSVPPYDLEGHYRVVRQLHMAEALGDDARFPGEFWFQRWRLIAPHLFMWGREPAQMMGVCE